MTYDPQYHNRRSIRLPGYDYTRAGAYFVTIVTWRRERLFGEILDGEMRVNELGNAAREEWFITARNRINVILYPNEMALMPNHLHGIIHIVDIQDQHVVVGAQRRCAPTDDPSNHASPINDIGPAINVTSGSLGAIVRAYKSAVTHRINAMRNTPASPVWQRNYYEHIIRDEEELKRIHNYIDVNPGNWQTDEENR